MNTRRAHETPEEHAHRIMRERRAREAAERRLSNAAQPFIDSGEPRAPRYLTARGSRIATEL